MGDQLLTLSEAASALGVSRMTVVRRVKDGSLRAVNLTAGLDARPSWRVAGIDLAEYVARRRTPGGGR